MVEAKRRIEFGIVARTFPRRNVGLIQASKDDVIYFQGKDRRTLKIDMVHNEIVFDRRHRDPNILKMGTLVVFERNRHYTPIRGLDYAGKWNDYASWATLHVGQMLNLKDFTQTDTDQDWLMRSIERIRQMLGK
jgi:hypothetical protein